MPVIKSVFSFISEMFQVATIAFAAILVYTMYADQGGFLAIIDNTNYIIHEAVNFLVNFIQTIFPG